MKSPSLVLFHKQLGDVLLLEPALAKLAKSTGRPVVLATRPEFSAMLSLMENVRPMLDEYFRRAASVISFEPRFRACIQALTTVSADKQLIVTRPNHLKPWHRFFFSGGCKAVNETGIYRAEYFFRVMPGESDMIFRPPRLRPPPIEWLPKGLPEQYVLLHATSAWRRKCWPAEAWAETLTQLHAQGVGPFVVTGGTAEWEVEYIQTLQAETSVPLINLCGKTSLEAYMAIVSNASMVLCIDGSASHLAAAFGRPALTLFGPSRSQEWHYPQANSVAIDARMYVDQRNPAVSEIPTAPVLLSACELWEQRKLQISDLR